MWAQVCACTLCVCKGTGVHSLCGSLSVCMHLDLVGSLKAHMCLSVHVHVGCVRTYVPTHSFV